jgi:hypothetical protein
VTDWLDASSGGLAATLPRMAKAEYTLGDQLDPGVWFTKSVERKNPMPSSRFRAALMSLAVIAFLWGQSFQNAAGQVPEENRKQVVEALGPPFIVFRDAVLDELKVSDEQREKLMQHIRDRIMETGPFLESLAQAGEEREKKLNEHKKIALEKLAKHLKEVLEPEQLKRLRQVTLQVEGAFALGQDDVRKELKITQEQMMKFGRDSTENRADSQGARPEARSRPQRRPEEAVERDAWPEV